MNFWSTFKGIEKLKTSVSSTKPRPTKIVDDNSSYSNYSHQPPDQSSPLTFFYSNVRSLLPKAHTLLNYASLYKPRVICLTETWLNNYTPSSLVCPPNYLSYRQDRRQGRGGGSLILINNQLDSFPVHVFSPTLLNDCNIDFVACRVHLAENTDLGILCIYRPPDSCVNDNLAMTNIIDKFLQFNFNQNIIIGDFNFPNIDWPVSALCNQSTMFLKFCQDCFLTQHVHLPTRKKSNNVLDLVFSTLGTNITDLGIHEEFGSSDHSIIQFAVPITSLHLKTTKTIVRDFKRVNWDLFRNLISSLPEMTVSLSTNNIDVVWDDFLKSLLSVIDKLAPHRTVSSRHFSSSSNVRTALRRKRRYLKALRLNPSTESLLQYEKAKAFAQKTIDRDLAVREARIAQTGNRKIFWSYVNRRMSNRPTIDYITHDGDEIRDHSSIANIFNDYFVSTFSNPTNNNPENACCDINHHPCLSAFEISIDDIKNVLDKIPTKQSVDSDGLSYLILKKGGIPLYLRLLPVFSLSLEVSKVPSSWKVACVTPIFKNGSRQQVNNYRPISVTSCCSRVLERIINNKIVDFLTRQSLLLDTQHGFRFGFSTDTVLLYFYDYVTEYLDKNLIVDSIFFDFKKAFDSVPHSILLSRLLKHGIHGKVFAWIKDFISSRFQVVRIAYSTSRPLPVQSGVIQGSVLGPTLFNIFLNEIDHVIMHCKVLKYADDIRIYLSSSKSISDLSDLQFKIQSDINNIVSWSNASGMSFNINKCFSASFGSSPSKRNYFISDSVIPYKEDFTDLGLRVHSPLSFTNHSDAIVSKAFSALGLIAKIFKFTNKKTLVLLYKSFVRSNLEYASLIWNPYLQMSINNLERVQKRMCRLIPEVRHLPYYSQLKSLGLMSLRARRLRYQLITIFKIRKGIINCNFNDFFNIRSSNKTRGHNCHIVAKHSRCNYRLHFFTVSSIALWNKFTQDEIDAASLTIFKSKITDLFDRMDIW